MTKATIAATKIKSSITPYDYYASQGLILTDPCPRGWCNRGLLCLFHDDQHSGNFGIRPDSGAYKCYACGAAGGDIISFERALHNLSFWNAINKLAKQWGVAI